MMHASTSLVGTTPVVDLDGTVFVQAGIFLLLMLILRGLLFKPWLAARERRVEKIDGAIAAASQLRQRAEALGLDYDARLAKAREQALEVRSEARRKSEGEGAEIVGGARHEATISLDQSRAKLVEEARVARQALVGKVDQLAAEIATRVLGRSA